MPDRPDGRLQDLVRTANAQARAIGEHSFRMIKQQFAMEQMRLMGMVKDLC
jgi:transposase, IS5 family